MPPAATAHHETYTGLYLPRFGAIIIGRGSIGENCTIEQNVTLGIAGRGAERWRPTIGKRVFIGAGSMIVGSRWATMRTSSPARW